MSAAFLRTDPHPLRDLDQLDVVARQHAPVFVEARPVGVGAADDDPPPFRQRIGDGAEVELAQVELFPRADREVLVVEEQCDAFFVVAQALATISATARRRRRGDEPAPGQRGDSEIDAETDERHEDAGLDAACSPGSAGSRRRRPRSANTIDSPVTTQRIRRPALRGRGGRDREAEHEQRADDLRRRGDGQREHEQEDHTEQADGNSARGGDVGVDRREQQRPVDRPPSRRPHRFRSRAARTAGRCSRRRCRRTRCSSPRWRSRGSSSSNSTPTPSPNARITPITESRSRALSPERADHGRDDQRADQRASDRVVVDEESRGRAGERELARPVHRERHVRASRRTARSGRT